MIKRVITTDRKTPLMQLVKTKLRSLAADVGVYLIALGPVIGIAMWIALASLLLWICFK